MKFELHSTEVENLEKWQKKIQKKIDKVVPKDPAMGKSYGHFVYKFYPTGIGTTCVVKEKHTGEKCDITNYELW